MDLNNIQTIDQVIKTLEAIIDESIQTNSTLGYFAVLYQKVTIKVKEGIASNFFEDNERMEKLDVIFAKRYIEAYYLYTQKKETNKSWNAAFRFSSKYWPIVLQHLTIGMNAHINLDLGIAAAEISKNKNIHLLENDFNKINEILSSLVNEVQDNLTKIWPTLRKILQKTNKVDDFLIDFSMELARDGAWQFALSLADKNPSLLKQLINERDQKIAKKAIIISQPGFIAKIILSIIRISERGTVSQKIMELKR